MANPNPSSQSLVDYTVFEHLQAKIDEDTQLRHEINDIVQTMGRQQRQTMSILSRCHSIPQSERQDTLHAAFCVLQDQRSTVQKLESVVSKQPYYKYNGMWSREIQELCFAILLCSWLGASPLFGRATPTRGSLLTIEEVGQFLQIPTNPSASSPNSSPTFHLTTEEYLHALISLTDELSRLAVNAVTLGDYAQPLQISRFVKDLHAGFQMLNLKNDGLRKRSDGVKYAVKKVEDVVYDLSLRGLVPRGREGEGEGEGGVSG